MSLVAVILVGKAYGALRTGGEAVSRKGVIVCVISGLLMGTWAPFVTLAMTRGAHTLTPYTTTVFLTLGAFICCFVFNIILMRKPIIGTPVAGRDYFRTSGKYHALGLLGGAIWGIGMAFNLVADRSSVCRSPMRSARLRRWWRAFGASSCGRNFVAPTRKPRAISRRCLRHTSLRSSSSQALTPHDCL